MAPLIADMEEETAPPMPVLVADMPFKELQRTARPRPDITVPNMIVPTAAQESQMLMRPPVNSPASSVKPLQPVATFAGRVIGPEETAQSALARVPIAELETAGRASTVGMDLAAGLALGKGAMMLATSPVATVKNIAASLPEWASKYRDTVDRFGESIMARVPKVLRAGRGTPLEFREANAQRLADISNATEQALELGTQLKRGLNRAEKMRADQILRGAESSGETNLMREAGQRLDGKLSQAGTDVSALQRSGKYQPALEHEADILAAEKAKNWSRIEKFDPDTGAPIKPRLNVKEAGEDVLYAMVRPVRKALDDIQGELVTLGRLSPEVVERFEQNFGPYIGRYYASKEFMKPDRAIVSAGSPIHAGTDRLKMRGERVEVEIPDFQKEMNAVARQLGPESEFRREFRSAAKEYPYKGKASTTTVTDKDAVSSVERTSKTETTRSVKTEGGEGEFTQVPLSGVAARLEKVVTDALETRGMFRAEAEAAVGRVKAAAVKAAQGGPEVKITGGGTTKETISERTTETVKERIMRERETVKETINGLGVNNAQKAALHAYYDAITRAGAKAKSIKVGDQTFKIDPVMDVESGLERTSALKPLLDAGYKVESRSGNRVNLFRDIPEEIRTAPVGEPVMKGGKQIGVGMGELRDSPGYTAAKSIAQTGSEVGAVRFFKTVADNPEWTSAAAKPGFIEMPKDEKRLASLAGKFVRSDIAAEITDATRIKQDWEKILNGVNSLWKIGKVTNPATIARNFMSSAEIARWGGLSYVRPSGIRSYEQTVEGLLGKNEKIAGYLAEAKQAGIYRSGFNQAEIKLLADGYAQSKETNPLLRIIEGAKSAVDKTQVGKVYGSVDNFYKSALYVHAREELGMTPQLATRYAKKFGIDYGDVSPFVRGAREIPLGSPFITFASKAIPLFFETAVKHPVRAFGVPGAIWGMSELSKRSFGEDGAKEISKMQEMGHLQSPRYAVLPTKTKEGRNQFLDLGYILPFGDVLEIVDRARGGAGTSISMEPFGGPFQSIVETAFNKSLFTDKEIWLPTDSYKERYAKISDHVLKSLLPAFAPPIPGTGFRGGYSVEEFRKAVDPSIQLPLESPISKTDFLGRQRNLQSTIASKVLGISVKDVSLVDLQRLGLIEMQGKLDLLNKQLTRMSMSGITDVQKQKQMEVLEAKYKALAEETNKKMTGGDKPKTSVQPKPAARVERRQVLEADLR